MFVHRGPALNVRFPLHCLDSMSERLGRIISNAFMVSIDKTLRTNGTPFVTELEIAYGHQVSELRREEKKKKEELCSLALALSLTLALTLTLYHLPTSYSGGPVHYPL